MSGAALVLHQFRYEQKVFWRSPAAVFFTVMFPVIFLLLFASLFGDERDRAALGIDAATYYVPGIITLAVVSATLVNVAMRMVEMRESGRLKRLRGTPLPTWAYIGGRIGNAFVVSLLMVVIVTVLGDVLYGVADPDDDDPGAAGDAARRHLRLLLARPRAQHARSRARTRRRRSPTSRSLPLYFLSGVFVPERRDPRRGPRVRRRSSRSDRSSRPS